MHLGKVYPSPPLLGQLDFPAARGRPVRPPVRTKRTIHNCEGRAYCSTGTLSRVYLLSQLVNFSWCRIGCAIVARERPCKVHAAVVMFLYPVTAAAALGGGPSRPLDSSSSSGGGLSAPRDNSSSTPPAWVSGSLLDHRRPECRSLFLFPAGLGVGLSLSARRRSLGVPGSLLTHRRPGCWSIFLLTAGLGVGFLSCSPPVWVSGSLLWLATGLRVRPCSCSPPAWVLIPFSLLLLTAGLGVGLSPLLAAGLSAGPFSCSLPAWVSGSFLTYHRPEYRTIFFLLVTATRWQQQWC